MIGCIMVFGNCEDGVKGVFGHDLWLDSSPGADVHGIWKSLLYYKV
jgi:hypothetical protein